MSSRRVPPPVLAAVLLLACAGAAAAAPRADAPAAPAGARPAPPDLAAYRALTLDAARPVGPVVARHGRLEIEMTSGLAFPIRAGGEVVGVQLEGDGVFRYAVDDRVDARTVPRNVAKVAPALTATPGGVTGSFTGATVLFGRPAFEPFWSGDAPAGPARGSGAAAEALRRTLDGADLSWTALLHYLPEARHGAGQFVYAEFEGRTRVGYQYDGLHGFSESLFTFRQFAGVAFRTHERLSSQRLPVDEGPPFVLERVDVRLDTKDNRSGTIAGTLVFRARREAARMLGLLLVNNRDPKTASWNSQRNALTVDAITDATGRALPFSHRCAELLVDLGVAPAKGATVELRFATHGDIFCDPSGYRADNYIEFWSVNWFPIPDQLAARRFTFTLEARTRKPFRPVSTGDQVALAEEGEQYVLQARSDVPVWELALFAGKYTTREIRDPRWTVRAHGYGVVAERDVDRLARAAATFMEIYEARLGPSALKEIEIVEIPSWSPSGISPPGLTMLTSSSFKPNDPLMHQYLDTRGTNALIAHELAHQWFGHRAWPRHEDDNWLTESVAEYLSGVAMGVAVQSAGLDKARLLDFREMLAQWRTWTNTAPREQSVAGANHIAGERARDDRFNQLYCRGPLVLHMYRTLVGEQRFFDTLRRYLDAAGAGPADMDDFVRAASAAVGEDVAWFFDQWIREPGIPEITVAQQVLSGPSGPTLSVHLAQDDEKRPFKKIHVPLVVEYADGRREVKLAFQQERRQRFDFPLAGPPARVLVDPGRNNLADYK